MTPLDLAPIEARAEAATKGPWDTLGGNLVRAIAADRELAVPIFRSEAPVDWHKNKRLTHPVFVRAYRDEVNNATFIAHAREDIPALIAEVRRLREELREVRQRAPLPTNDLSFW